MIIRDKGMCMKILCIGNSFSTDATTYLSRVAASAGITLETYNLYIGGCSLERHWNNMKILCIGNSFSTDATTYLSRVAASAGITLETYNLYIGGCSLERHWNNVKTEAKEYLLEINGISTEKMVSIQDMLEESYDVITLQQASHFSTKYETYQPYLNNLTNWLRDHGKFGEFVLHQTWAYEEGSKRLTEEMGYQNQADMFYDLKEAYDWLRDHGKFGEFVLHQTWAYEEGSKRLTEEMGYQNQADMFYDLKEAYAQAARDSGILRMIPSGQMFQDLLQAGIGKIHRDTFHALIPMGRYALALLWFTVLTGISPRKVMFCPEGMNEILAKAVRELVHASYLGFQEKK